MCYPRLTGEEPGLREARVALEGLSDVPTHLKANSYATHTSRTSSTTFPSPSSWCPLQRTGAWPCLLSFSFTPHIQPTWKSCCFCLQTALIPPLPILIQGTTAGPLQQTPTRHLPLPSVLHTATRASQVEQGRSWPSPLGTSRGSSSLRKQDKGPAMACVTLYSLPPLSLTSTPITPNSHSTPAT